MGGAELTTVVTLEGPSVAVRVLLEGRQERLCSPHDPLHVFCHYHLLPVQSSNTGCLVLDATLQSHEPNEASRCSLVMGKLTGAPGLQKVAESRASELFFTQDP